MSTALFRRISVWSFTIAIMGGLFVPGESARGQSKKGTDAKSAVTAKNDSKSPETKGSEAKESKEPAVAEPGATEVAAPRAAVSSKKPSSTTMTKAERTAGRLPRYYSKLVNETQRMKIYEIQSRYLDRIAELEAQLEALRNEQAAEIEGLLTDEQRVEIEQRRAASVRTSRRAPASDSSEPESGMSG